MLASLLPTLLGGIFTVVDKAVEDKDQAAAIKARFQELALAGRMKELDAAARIIEAEARGESWLQRNWRPLLMCLFGLIVANNYVVSPLFSTPMADIPPDMCDLLKLGVGGYVLGRSVEKGARAWKHSSN